MRVVAVLLIAVLAGSALSSPVDWRWRLACALAVTGAGLMSWRRYLRRRPCGLTARPDGRLLCERPGRGREHVVAVREGVVRPWLVSARLTLRDGSGCDLFVPGWAVPAATHWALRRVVIGFRPPRAGPGAAAAQSGERRGT